jgi:regulator of chromosome condensation RCC1
VGADFRLRVGLQNKSVYFKKLAEYGSGYEHNCAIMSDDSVYCWGNGQYGVLGTNSTASSTTPVPVYSQDVLNGKTIKQITTGFYHTCVIASDNKDYCWGYGTFGRLGNNGIVQKNAPYPVREFATTVVSQIAAGNEHTCSLNSEGKLYCWGKGINGELGRDVFLGSNTPTAVNMSNFGTESVKQVVAGDKFTCASTVEGTAFCWGSNDKGRTGVGLATGKTQYPTAVKGFNGKKS